MRRGTIVLVLCCVLTLCLGLAACRKLPASGSTVSQLTIERLKALDSVPLEYGSLVSVTSDGAPSAWAQLWFEKSDRTIMVVKVNFQTGEMSEFVLAIPRR